GIRDFHVTGVQTCALPIFRIERRRIEVERLPDRWAGAAAQHAQRVQPAGREITAAVWHEPENGAGLAWRARVLQAARLRDAVQEIGRASCRERVYRSRGAR